MAMKFSLLSVRKYHRRLAVVLGVFFLFQGLSGAVAQYRWWLLQATEPATYRTTPEGPLVTPGAVLATIERDRPGFNTAHVMYPAANTPQAAVVAMGGRSDSAHDMSLIVTVDPYKSRAIAEVSARAGWVGTVATLHRWLIFGTPGRVILTIVGLGLIAMSTLGLLLWWRTRRADAHARGAARLHRLTGAALGALLLMAATTGTALNLFIWYEKAAGTSITARNMAAVEDHSNHHPPSITADQAYRVALGRVGNQQLAAFSPAGAHALHYWFAFNDRQLKRTDVLVSATDGRVIGTYPAGVADAGPVRQWLYPIHTGYIIGPAGGAIMTVVGLMTLLWVWSGLVIWRRSKKRKVRDPAVLVASAPTLN